MKKYLKTLIFVFAASTFVACTNEDDTELPGDIQRATFSEEFERPVGQPAFSFENWTRFAQAGTKQWNRLSRTTVVDPAHPEQTYTNNFIEFSSFASNEASNIGWAISPAIDLNATLDGLPLKKRLVFQSAQHHAVDLANKFELLVSTDFDGTNVLNATWTTVPFILPTYTNSRNYDMVKSGVIDLSAYSGNIYIAFRVTGNGLNNSTLTGGFQVDNIKVF